MLPEERIQGQEEERQGKTIVRACPLPSQQNAYGTQQSISGTGRMQCTVVGRGCRVWRLLCSRASHILED